MHELVLGRRSLWWPCDGSIGSVGDSLGRLLAVAPPSLPARWVFRRLFTASGDNESEAEAPNSELKVVSRVLCVVCLIWPRSCGGNKHSFLSSYTLWRVMALLTPPPPTPPPLSGACNSCKLGVTRAVCSSFHSGCEADKVTCRNGKRRFEVWNGRYRCVYETTIQVHFWGLKNRTFCGKEKEPAGGGRSEAEWSCPNTGDGCNGILSLNDAHRGQRVITSSQLVYQPERWREEEPGGRGTGDFIASVLLHSFGVSIHV